jgi:outer membrane immunogenic protein
MRNQFLCAATAVAAIAAASPSLAQNASTWDGIYVGGSVGVPAQPNDGNSSILFDTDQDGEFGDTVNTIGATDAFSPGFCGGRANGPTPADGCADDKDGIEYYGMIGFDKQMGNVVVGLVGEGGKSEATDSVSAFSTTPARYTMTRKAKYNAGLRARIGYTPNGATLFYATGGGAYAKIRNTFSTSNGANSFVGNGNSDAWGYSVGGGVDQKIGDNFSIGLLYLMTSLKADDYRVTAGPGTAPATNPFLLVDPNGTVFRRSDDNFRTHSIRATAAFRF